MNKCAHAPCQQQIGQTLLMCREHWGLVDPVTQQRVYDTYRKWRAFSEDMTETLAIIKDYREAVEQAKKEVAEKTAQPPQFKF